MGMIRSIGLGIIISAAFISNANAQPCPRLSNGVRINATGDILVHKALFEYALSHPSRFRSLWNEVTPVLRNADLTYGNLEGPTAPGVAIGGRETRDPGPVYDSHVYSGTNFVFNFHPSLIDDLRSSGFGLVSTANNHSLDRGPLGVDRSIQELRRRGLPFVGWRSRNSQEPRSIILNVKGQRLGAIACTETTNGMRDPHGQILMCKSAEVVEEISRLKSKTDLVLVLPHWGSEYQGTPHGGQKALARRWVQAGAQVIIGNHPHVLQTVEWLQSPDGANAIVIYSLGNFVAWQGGLEKKTSAITHLDFVPSASGLKLEQFSYTPVTRRSGAAGLSIASGASVEGQHVRRQLGPVHCR